MRRVYDLDPYASAPVTGAGRPKRPLTADQESSLRLMSRGSFTHQTMRQAPSLAGRGLVEKYRYTEGGRSLIGWRVTEAGLAEVERTETPRAEPG